jgi:NADPH-dependent 7-cyano-7-deazaguanine reductase QueF
MYNENFSIMNNIYEDILKFINNEKLLIYINYPFI